MSAQPSGTSADDSTLPRAAGGLRTLLAARAGLAIAGLAGALALLVSTWAAVVHVVAVGKGRTVATSSGADLHGPALALVALFAVVVLAGGLRGARPAMLAVAACGVAALGVAVLRDVPRLDDAGEVGVQYDDAKAGAAAGFYLETLGGVCLLVSGGGLLVLTAPGRR